MATGMTQNISHFTKAKSVAIRIIAHDRLHLPSTLLCLVLLLSVLVPRGGAAGELSRKREADGLADKARAAFAEGRYSDVAAEGTPALKLYRQLHDERAEGEMLQVLGQAERRLANYGQAIAWHEQALALARAGGDRLGQGRTLIDLGDVYERQKDEKKAIRTYEEAIALLKAPEQWREAGRGLRQLGDALVATGAFEAAYQAYSRALLLAEAAHDPVYLAEFNDYVGYFHRRLGDFETAVDYHTRALEAARHITDDAVRFAAQARGLNHLGLCKAEQAARAVAGKDVAGGRALYREAARDEEEALRLSTRTADRWREGYVLRALAQVHRELGQTLHDAGEASIEYRQSLGCAAEALQLALFMKEKEWQGLALHHKGMAQGLLGERQAGLETFQEALAVWESTGDLLSMGFALRYMARNFYEAEGRLGEARTFYERARTVFARLGDLESEAGISLDEARLSAAEGKKTEAAALYEQGLARMEQVRAHAGLLEFKKSYMERVYDRYEEAAVYMLENGFHTRAFTRVEAMKARVFLDQLAEGRVDLEAGIDPDLKRKRDALEARLSDAGREIAESFKAAPQPDARRIESLKTAQQAIATELETITQQIRLRNPLYAAVRYPKPVTVTHLQQAILKPDEVMVEYFLSPAGVYALVVSRDSYVTLRLSQGEMETRSVRA